MGKTVKPLPPLVVRIREGQPTPATAAAWSKLWRLLLETEKETPDPGGDDRGGQAGASGDEPEATELS